MGCSSAASDAAAVLDAPNLAQLAPCCTAASAGQQVAALAACHALSCAVACAAVPHSAAQRAALRPQAVVHDLVRHMRKTTPVPGSFSAHLQATLDPHTLKPLSDASVSTEVAALFFAGVRRPSACMPGRCGDTWCCIARLS